MPILLIVAIGFPIWHVMQQNPVQDLNSIADPYGISGNASGSNPFMQAKYAAPSQPFASSDPISVPAQSSYYNPANPGKVTIVGQPSQPVSAADLSPQGFTTPGAFHAMGGGTVVLPGNEFAPNLNATPLEFLPVTNLEEIIRFDVFPTWVKSRWERVSATPGEIGLHGFRVSLVTGTNTDDLHGSLTYFFDANQRVQRITFRGWAGNATKLVNLLVRKYGYQAKPTQLAGFYVGQTNRNKLHGTLVMKNPTVIHSNNRSQQVAIAMEINRPDGPFGLSSEFQSIVAEAQTPY